MGPGREGHMVVRMWCKVKETPVQATKQFSLDQMDGAEEVNQTPKTVGDSGT